MSFIHRVYDPLIGFSKGGCPIQGTQVWPPDRKWAEGNCRILILGGSTSQWPSDQTQEHNHLLGTWGLSLGTLLEEQGLRPLIFNAAVAGYGSDQELLRLIRDAPGIQPNLIVSLSGVNDVGFIHAAFPYNLIHSYQASNAARIVSSSNSLEGYVLGIPTFTDASAKWVRNVRLAKSVSNVLGASYLCFLQPILGTHEAPAVTEYEKNLVDLASRTLVHGRPYPECLEEFFLRTREALRKNEEGIAEYAIDLSGALRGIEHAWVDARHPGAVGNQILAERILKTILQKGILNHL
jgi:lysophospholipase L1-like esterase